MFNAKLVDNITGNWSSFPVIASKLPGVIVVDFTGHVPQAGSQWHAGHFQEGSPYLWYCLDKRFQLRRESHAALWMATEDGQQLDIHQGVWLPFSPETVPCPDGWNFALRLFKALVGVKALEFTVSPPARGLPPSVALEVTSPSWAGEMLSPMFGFGALHAIDIPERRWTNRRLIKRIQHFLSVATGVYKKRPYWDTTAEIVENMRDRNLQPTRVVAVPGFEQWAKVMIYDDGSYRFETSEAFGGPESFVIRHARSLKEAVELSAAEMMRLEDNAT